MHNMADIRKKIVGLFHYISCAALEYFPDVDHINDLRARWSVRETRVKVEG